MILHSPPWPASFKWWSSLRGSPSLTCLTPRNILASRGLFHDTCKGRHRSLKKVFTIQGLTTVASRLGTQLESNLLCLDAYECIVPVAQCGSTCMTTVPHVQFFEAAKRNMLEFKHTKKRHGRQALLARTGYLASGSLCSRSTWCWVQQLDTCTGRSPSSGCHVS